MLFVDKISMSSCNNSINFSIIDDSEFFQILVTHNFIKYYLIPSGWPLLFFKSKIPAYALVL